MNCSRGSFTVDKQTFRVIVEDLLQRFITIKNVCKRYIVPSEMVYL